MNRTTLIHVNACLLAACVLVGCSADGYRRSADRQVQSILRDRKRGVLDYEPKTEPQRDSPAATAAAVPARAYEKFPATPVPPPAPPPIEPSPPTLVPYGPLGPEARWMGLPVPKETSSYAGVDLGSGEGRAYLYGPPAPRQAPTRFDLFRALEFAVQNSREYQDEIESLYLTALDVTLERHLLSPRPFARGGLEYAGGQGDVNYRSALIATGGVGVRQRLPYGGEVIAETLVQFVNALSNNADEGESASLVLSGSVPLLRGAGLVNLEALIAQERELIYRVRAFEEFRRSFAVTVASQYFNLRSRQQSILNRRLNLANTVLLLERTQALYAAGRTTFLQVQRAEQAVLQGEDLFVAAREAYANALDDFKVLLGMDVAEPIEIVPIELDLNLPDTEGRDVLELARQYRLDLQTARDRIDDARRGVEVERNGLLPDLNLTARAAAGNRGESPARELDSRTLTYTAGVNLDLPIDRVAERNAYRRSLIRFQRAQRDFAELTDRITADVQEAVRGIRAARSSLAIQRRSIGLAERRVELATELLNRERAQGGSDARDVVEAQSALLTAQDAFERARAQLQVQVLQFLRDTGTLRVDPAAGAIGRALERNGRQRPEGDGPGNETENRG